MRAFLVAACVVWAGLGLAAPLIQVEPGESLQEAIASAPAGAVIQLGEGTWTGGLTIDKSLTIRGRGPEATVITAAEDGVPVITVASTQTISVTLVGLRIGGGKGKCAAPSRRLCPHGLLVAGKARVTLVSCELAGNAACGAFVIDDAALWANDTAFLKNQTGLWVQGEAHATIRNSRLTGNYFGLIAAGEARVEAEGCSISGNVVDGVLAADRARVYLWGNEIARNGRVGVALHVPGCYRAGREFEGLVRGAENTVPREGKDANALSPFCPQALEPLGTELGGIYPPVNPVAVLAELGLSLPPLGDGSAPVAMLEFADFSCPFCAEFATETLPRLEEEYIGLGKVRLYFLPFPVHGEPARLGAEAAFCAAAQGLYWEFSEAAFRYSREHKFPELTAEELAGIMESVGGDPERLLSCLKAGTYRETVESAIELARELGVQGTPAFFLGSYAIPGAYPYQVFRAVIDSLLERNE